MDFPWKDNWLDLQKQYLDALTSGGAKSDWFTAAPGDPLSQMLFPGMGPGAMPPFPGTVPGIDSFFKYGQHSSDLFKQFQSLLKNMSGGETRNEDNWEQLLKEQFEALKTRLAAGDSQAPIDAWKDGLEKSMQVWKDGLEKSMQAWQALPGSAAPDHPGGKQASAQDWPDALRNEFLRAAGFAEESKLQADLRDVTRYWEQYTEQSHRFQEILKSVDIAALDALRDRFLEMGKEGASVSSLREIYALWIDSHEESWSKILRSDDFSRVYGELINSYLKLSKHFQSMQSRLYDVMQKTNRQNRELTDKVEELIRCREQDRKKIEALKATVEKLKKAPSARKTGPKDSDGKVRKDRKKKKSKKSTKKKDKNAKSKSR